MNDTTTSINIRAKAIMAEALEVMQRVNPLIDSITLTSRGDWAAWVGADIKIGTTIRVVLDQIPTAAQAKEIKRAKLLKELEALDATTTN